MTNSLHISNLIRNCAETTKSKGFDVSQVGTQVALFVTEVSEALELVSSTGDPVTDGYIEKIRRASTNFEAYRKHAKGVHADNSEIANLKEFLEELADTVIRIFSFVGGNGYADLFITELEHKMTRNQSRPEKHGKNF